jgi:hypothetical protein
MQSAGAPQGQDARGPVPPRGAGGGTGRRGRQLPPRGGARAELPGGPQQRVPSWGDENARPPVPRDALDAPRGHDEPDVSQTSRLPRVDDRQGPGATAEIPVIGQGAGDYPRPGPDTAAGPGRFARQDLFGGTGQNAQNDQNTAGDFGDPSRTDQFAAPQGYDNGSTGQFAAPVAPQAPQAYDNGSTGQYPAVPTYDNGATGQYPAQGHDGSTTGRHALPGAPQDPSATGRFERPQGDFGQRQVPQRPQRPVRQEPEALPPAPTPGDGRTPLYDTLETNWFRGQQGQADQSGQNAQADQNGQAGQAGRPGQQSPQGRPEQPQGPGLTPAPQAPASPQRPAAPAWRSSPNDDLVRQAERVRQPAAGGVTTSGLPRRVPRANLVPGTAQQQQHQSGPQVSRAPQDVRGRLTNLRRGIAQGRQAGSGQTGSFPSPTHQQER